MCFVVRCTPLAAVLLSTNARKETIAKGAYHGDIADHTADNAQVDRAARKTLGISCDNGERKYWLPHP